MDRADVEPDDWLHEDIPWLQPLLRRMIFEISPAASFLIVVAPPWQAILELDRKHCGDIGAGSEGVP